MEKERDKGEEKERKKKKQEGMESKKIEGQKKEISACKRGTLGKEEEKGILKKINDQNEYGTLHSNIIELCYGILLKITYLKIKKSFQFIYQGTKHSTGTYYEHLVHF